MQVTALECPKEVRLPRRNLTSFYTIFILFYTIFIYLLLVKFFRFVA